MRRRRLLFVFGTRPEAIKLAPVIHEARRRAERCEPIVCVTAQHRRMLDQVLDIFGIVPDHDLDLMTPGQTLHDLTARVLTAMRPVLQSTRPDMVIVQGDTTTVMAGALASFYERLPVGHVEAGLRTYDRFQPFPEEINRVLTTQLADLHFAPTERSADNLRRENVADARIVVTGNSVIDALFLVLDRVRAERPAVPGLDEADLAAGRPLVLITGHRRENFGDGFRHICEAVAELARRFPDTLFVYPVHLNPNVQQPVHATLGAISNVRLIEPLAYLPFVRLMDAARVILTDSGGVQEEAPSLGKPVLVMRETTERPEAIDAGTVELVGASRERIVGGVTRLLTDAGAYEAMARAHNPYGDGHASPRILDAIERFFEGDAAAASSREAGVSARVG